MAQANDEIAKAKELLEKAEVLELETNSSRNYYELALKEREEGNYSSAFSYARQAATILGNQLAEKKPGGGTVLGVELIGLVCVIALGVYAAYFYLRKRQPKEPQEGAAYEDLLTKIE